MSRIERSYENYEIYGNSQDHWQSLCNLFKGLQGSPIKSYKNCENYEIYENCEIYDNSQDHWQSQRNLFKGLQGSPIESYENCKKITKFTKTAKFTIICQTTYKINKIYSKGCREGPLKVTKFTKTVKFTIIRKTIDKINEIYSKRCREGPSIVTRIAKFMETAKFTIILICIFW